MGRLDDNATLLNALHNNTPFVYAHLVKFEKPVTAIRSVASNDNITYREAATDFIYLTDGAFDIVFDDGSKDSQGNAHGAQTYAANKLLNVGSLSDSSELKVAGTSIVLDSSSIDASVFGTGKFYKEKQEEKKENIYSNIDEMLGSTLKETDSD